MYTEIDQIAESMALDDRGKIDRLLHMDALLYANMGTDSTAEERSDVKRKSRMIYRVIKSIDVEMGDTFLRAMRDESD